MRIFRCLLLAFFAVSGAGVTYAQHIDVTDVNYGNGNVVKEISGNGSPASVCTGLTRYTQKDAQAGLNTWDCINGTMVQQGGAVSGTVAHATNADFATNATNATHANTATTATSATTAGTATSAGTATTANYATTAGSTTNALGINGTSVAANTSGDQVLRTTATATAGWAALPDCASDGSHAIVYSVSSHAFQCVMVNGSGITLKTNSTLNTTQNVLNIVAGANIGAVADSAGNVTISSTGGVSGFSGIASVSGGLQAALNSSPCTSGVSGCNVVLDPGSSTAPAVVENPFGLLQSSVSVGPKTGVVDIQNGGFITNHFDAVGTGANCISDSNKYNYTCGTWNDQVTAPGQNVESGVNPYTVGSFVNQGFQLNYYATSSGSKNIFTVNSTTIGDGEVNVIQSSPQFRSGWSQGDSEHMILEGFEPTEMGSAQGYNLTSTAFSIDSSGNITPATLTFNAAGPPVGNGLPIVDLNSGIGIRGATSGPAVGSSPNSVTEVITGSTTVPKSTAIGDQLSWAYVPTNYAYSSDGKEVIPYVTDIAVATAGTDFYGVPNYGTFAVGQLVTVTGDCCFIEQATITAVSPAGGNPYNTATAYRLGQVVSSSGTLYTCSTISGCPAGSNPASSGLWTGYGSNTNTVVISVPLRYGHYSTQFPVCQAGLAGYSMEVNNQSTTVGANATVTYAYEYPVMCSPGSSDPSVTTTNTFYAASIANGNILSGGVGDGNITLHKKATVYTILQFPTQQDSQYIVEVEDHLPFGDGDSIQQSSYPFSGVQMYRGALTTYDKTGGAAFFSMSLEGAASNGVFFNLLDIPGQFFQGNQANAIIHMGGPYQYFFDSPSNGPSVGFANLGCPPAGCADGNLINLFSLDKDGSGSGTPILSMDSGNQQLYVSSAFNMGEFFTVTEPNHTSEIDSQWDGPALTLTNNRNPPHSPLLIQSTYQLLDLQGTSLANGTRPTYTLSIIPVTPGPYIDSGLFTAINGSYRMRLRDNGELDTSSDGSTWATVCTSLNNACGAFYNPNAVALTGGSINNTVIGSTTPLQGYFTDATAADYLGPATAPTGSCSKNGAWVLSQDAHLTVCSGGTWTSKL